MARGSRAPRSFGRYNYYDLHGNRLLTVSEQEGKKMQASGLAVMLCRFCKRGELDARHQECAEGRTEHDLVLQQPKPQLKSSDATIRMREMMANAGLDDKKSVIEAAREKVKQWGEIQRQVFRDLTVTA